MDPSNYIDRIASQIAAEVDDAEPTPEDQRLYRIYALLALVRGTETSLEDVHDAWSAWRADTKPDHKSLVPFDHLTAFVQSLDAPYRDAIHRVARNLYKAGAS
jgi:hypothetical protein